MPLVASHDPGNRDGKVHSHRFPAANTAVAHANQDEAQMKATEEFLKSGFITVDIFAVSPADDHAGPDRDGAAHARPCRPMSTFAVGEEAEQSGPAVIREVGKLSAPIGAAGSALDPGSTARVDVVVRTRKIGHFFPGGTVDAFDVWLELQAKDADGRVDLLERQRDRRRQGSGGAGRAFLPLLPARRRRQPDQQAQCLAGAQRAVRAADSARRGRRGALPRARFRKDAKGPITFTAKLNYRKFSRYYTQFAYAGTAQAGPGPGAADARPQQPGVRVHAGAIPGQRLRARSATAFPTCRS